MGIGWELDGREMGIGWLIGWELNGSQMGVGWESERTPIIAIGVWEKSKKNQIL